MNEFYRLLSQYYDELFPAEPATTRFLLDEFKSRCDDTADGGASTLVDAGCGTGNYTEALNAAGCRCVGFDNDPAMITRAHTAEKRGRFFVLDLLELASLSERITDERSRVGFSQSSALSEFAGVFCIGNTLPHLPDRGAVSRFFCAAAEILLQDDEPRQLVVQTVNFSRFERGGDLPSIAAPQVAMHRSYIESGRKDSLIFRVEIETAHGEHASAETPLLALRAQELKALARDAGFQETTLYGNFDRTRFQRRESFLSVLVAR